MWTCPECERSFTAKGQWHSCLKHDLEHHFSNRESWFFDCFELLKAYAETLGGVSIISLKTVIQFQTQSTFLSFMPRKDHIRLEFKSEEKMEDFSIIKSVTISSKRHYNIAVIDSQEDIDDQIKKWIKKSYELCMR